MLVRMDAETMEAIEKWAADEFRSTNGQLQWIIRGIFDQSDVGIVIAGEPRLEAEIKGNLARFANRMDFYYKLKGLSPQEVKDYMEGYDVDDAAMMEFISRATNAQTGCFRLLDRTLNNVIRILKENGQTQITMKIVNQASNMMML